MTDFRFIKPVLVFVVAFFAASCDNNEKVGELDATVYRSYGRVETVGEVETSSDFNVITDSGRKLHPSTSVVGTVNNNSRVIVHYILANGGDINHIGFSDQAVDIKLLKLEEVPVQAVLPIKYVANTYGDSLSVSGYVFSGSIINIENIWFGGRYVNIEYRLARKKGSGLGHFVNAVVYNQTNGADSTRIVLTFCHGAEGRTRERPQTAAEVADYELGPLEMMSFDLTSIWNGAYNAPPVISFHWDEYEYAKGWTAGFNCCRTNHVSNPVTPGYVPSITKSWMVTVVGGP